MTTFVLVPGASHGAWCWDRVAPLLEQAGYGVAAIDLPGTGADRSIRPGDATLALWAEHIAAEVRAVDPPVLLVGHSRGGYLISEAAEMVPDELRGLIYVSAVIPLPGEDLLTATGWDRGNLEVDEQGLLVEWAPEITNTLYYNRCASEVREEASRRLFAEPYRPLVDVSGVSAERWGRVPRAYLECADDNTFPLEVQRRMQATAPCDPVITLDSDHSPFLSVPEDLAAAMIEVARRLVPGPAPS
jgi:pimeloyl-ACP methyl ester carboxylesterase